MSNTSVKGTMFGDGASWVELYSIDVAATFGVPLTTVGDLQKLINDIDAGKHDELLSELTNEDRMETLEALDSICNSIKVDRNNADVIPCKVSYADDLINLNVDESTIPSDPIVQSVDINKSTSYAGVAGGSAKDQPNVNSNFRTLVADPVFDGVNISIPRKVVEKVSTRFEHTLYGYFIGKRMAFPVVEYYARNNWAKHGLKRIMMNSKGFFFFKFDSRAGLEAVLEGGPWLIRKSPIILKKWSMDTRLLKEELTRIPIWVKLHDVPIQVFEEDGISLIATFIGKPVMLDSYTSSMCNDSWGRSSFARCLIEVNSEADLVDVVTIGIPSLSEDDFTKETIRVEYEWRPPRCDTCKIFGHVHDYCPKKVVSPPIVATSNVVTPNAEKTNDGFQTVGKKKKRKGKSKSTNGGQFTGPSVKHNVRYEPKATTSAPKKGTTYVGYTSQSTPMLKTTGNSSKKDNLSMSNSFSALNEEEEDKSTSYAGVTGGSAKDQPNVNSNFRTLVADPVFDGVNISIPRKVVEKVSTRFEHTLYGYFIGKRMAFPVVEYYARNNWAKHGLKRIMMNSKGFFFFKFDSRTSLEAFLEGGPWLIRKSPIILKKWSMDTRLLKEELTRIPIWVKLHDVPIQVFEEDGISLIATFIGKPVMLDSYTSSMCNDSWGRSSFARCLIEVNSEADLVDVVTIGILSLSKDDFTKETIRVEYEWRPPRCDTCKIFGHVHDYCPKKVVSPPIVATSNVVTPNAEKTNDGFQTVGKKKKRKGKSKSTNGGQFTGPSVKHNVRYEPKATTSAPKKGTTYVGYTSQSTPMLKTTGNSSKKDNLSMSNSFSALNEEEEEDEEDVENVYDESANLIQNTKAGGSSSFTAAAG
ncbi:zinc knuckle CX2CX4HX4C containing protein [Tanacetum coccineum]|uniref:Zinc knuckle CX2CX4HX4C containing protein n=1 Tax=Tanacetum coccineum TaxID=301880 RepID=A0ABQ5CYP6_9ASTR